jgi:hypothetical protein
MMGAVALPLNGDKLSVGNRKHRSLARQSNLEWLVALATTLFLPGESKPRHGHTSFLAERCRFLPLLTQDFLDGYRALFLSRS